MPISTKDNSNNSQSFLITVNRFLGFIPIINNDKISWSVKFPKI